MISTVCLWWIGCKLNAPTWYYAIIIIRGVSLLYNDWKVAIFKRKIRKCLIILKEIVNKDNLTGIK